MSDSLHAIWVDPLAFDVLENGPPYMPERSMRTAMNKEGHVELIRPGYELGALVAVLRAASLVHQTHHWQTQGSPFYGDHLMFMRIYDESQGFIDSVAERSVGLMGVAAVRPLAQTQIMDGLVAQWCGGEETRPSEEMVQVSLGVEQFVLACVAKARKLLESQGKLTDGTDNLLQGVADKHEEFVYLLQQRSKTKLALSYSYDRKIK